MSNKPTTYVALLRGVNVGGHTLVSMTALKVCFEKLGFTDVKTYINSGNIIFRTAQTDPRALEITIEKVLETDFSHSIRVVVRSLKEMQQLIDHLPKNWANASDQRCTVIFLRHSIDNANILHNLKPKPDIEELHYQPGVLFWSAKTSNLTKSNMIKLAASPLYKEMTIRILNSTRKIYEIMRITDELPLQ